jgi:hypothetical protein
MKEDKNKLVARTIDVWKRRVNEPLSPEDATLLIENVSGFFTVLLEWEAAENERQAAERSGSYYAKSA